MIDGERIKEETLKEKQYIFSTRTLYGVYRATREFVPMFVIFQLAPATECIISGRDVFAPCSFSTRTHLRSVSAKLLNFMLQNMPFSFV